MRGAYEMAASVLWAMDEAALEGLLAIALRDNPSLEALEAERGKPLNNTRTARVRDGVATIPVVGPIFRYANLFTSVSGATSFQSFATDFNQALKDTDVEAIVIDINSPGGTVDGTNETAQMIRAAVGKGKPIVAFASHVMASAAYWIGSAAEWIVAEETTLVGSIGVRASYLDTKDREKAMGIKRHEIVSSQSPLKQLDPSADEGRSALQARVDSVAQLFVDAVAQQRGVSALKVMNEFGRGDVLLAAAAKSVGMIDAIGTQEQLHSALVAQLRGKPAGGSRRLLPAKLGSHKRSVSMSEKITAASIAAEYPEVAAALRADGEKDGFAKGRTDGFAAGEKAGYEKGKTEGATEGEKVGAAKGAAAELERIKAIDAATVTGFEVQAAECKADGKSTAADYAVKVLEAQKKKQTEGLASLSGDEKGRKTLPAAEPGNDPAQPKVDAITLQEQIEAKMTAAKAAGRNMSPAEAMAQIKREQKQAA